MAAIGIMNTQMKNNVFEYSISNMWKKQEKGKFTAAIAKVDKRYFLEYNIEKFAIPPWSIWKFFSDNRPTDIVLKSDIISGTLEQYIQAFYSQPVRDIKMMYSIVYELISGILSMNDWDAGIMEYNDLCCLDPSLISVKYVTDTQKFEVKFTSYIPKLFWSDYKQGERLMYISPQHLRYLTQAPTDHFAQDPNKVMYSFAVLLVKMFTQRIPFVQGSIIYDARAKPEIDWNLIGAISNIDRNVAEFVTEAFNGNMKIDGLKTSKIYQFARERYNEKTCNINSFYGMKNYLTEGDAFYCRAKQRIGQTRDRDVYFKILKIDNTNNLRAKIENEYDIMRLCKHNEFLEAYALFYSEGSSILGIEDKCLYSHLVLEYNAGGTLKTYVKKEYPNKMLPKEFMNNLTLQMLKALWFLHGEKGIIHRAISLDSICICKDKNKNITFKLGDFVSARAIDSKAAAAVTTIGNFDYAAPEIGKEGQYWKGYTYKVDLWLLGVMLFWSRTRFMPFSSLNQKVILYQTYGVKPNFDDLYWNDIKEIKELCQRIFIFDDYERIGLPEIHRGYWGNKMGLKKGVLIDYSTLSHLAYKLKNPDYH